MSEQFSILLGNHSRLEAGQTNGVWLSMPATTEQLHEAMRNIGVTAENPQDLFVGGFANTEQCPFDVPLSVIQSGSIDELNYLGKLLEMQRDEDKAKFAAAVTLGEYAGNLKDLINLAQNLDCYWIYPTVQSEEDYGYYLIDELDELELPEEAKRYFMYEEYGRDAAINDGGRFTEQGYIYNNKNTFSEWYNGRESDIPKEYRIMSYPQPERGETERTDFDAAATMPPTAEPRPVIPLILTADNPADKMKEITDRLEQGIMGVFESERYAEYLRTMSKFHNYSLNNTLLIAMQGGNLVKGYRQWEKEFDRHVKPGEKAIKILAPAPYKVKKEREKIDPDTKMPVIGADGKPVMETQEITIPAYKVVSVFDVSQTEGKEPPAVKYYPINEAAARRAKEMNSYSDYKPGSATAEYRSYVEEAVQLAERQKSRVDPMYHEKIDSLLDTYARKLAANMNKGFEIDARVPSILIAGGSNFPVRKKEKQNAARDTNYREWQDIQGLLDKIRSTGMGGISADDPQAVQKLEKKLAGLEKAQETMKAVNAYYRKHKTLDGCPHLSAESIEKMKADMASQWHIEDKPYPTWALSNNSAEIRRVKERIKSLSQQREIGYVGWEFEGGKVEANAEANRLQILFEEKPDAATREELKSNGFRWSPKAEAWQRQLTDNAYRSADYIKAILPLSGEKPSELLRAHIRQQKSASQEAPAPEPIYKVHTNPRSDSRENLCFLQAYIPQEDGKAQIGDVLYIGTPEKCRELMAQLNAGELTQGEVKELYAKAQEAGQDKDTFSIYQLKRGDETRDLRFEPYDRLQAAGHAVDRANYELIYTAPLAPDTSLEDIYTRFNIDHPADFKGHSLSVSDIVVLHRDGRDAAHYVDSIGYREVPEFFKEQGRQLTPDELETGETVKTPRGTFYVTTMSREQMEAAGYGLHHQSEDGKYLIMGNGTRAFAIPAEQPEKVNPLKHIEDTVEQNDNAFDGLINNTPQTPTAGELEQKAKAGEPISLADYAAAIKAEKERGSAKQEKPSIRAQLRAEKERAAQKKTVKAKNHELEV